MVLYTNGDQGRLIMKLFQKKGAFIALLLISLSFNTYTMELETKQSSWLTWLGSEILGVKVYETTSYSSFNNLPKEIQNIILSYVYMGANAKSVKEAGQAINSLAQVNNELNQFINDPQFCLQTIKHLAKKFNCTDETAALALNTTEAKRRLGIQKEALT